MYIMKDGSTLFRFGHEMRLSGLFLANRVGARYIGFMSADDMAFE